MSELRNDQIRADAFRRGYLRGQLRILSDLGKQAEHWDDAAARVTVETWYEAARDAAAQLGLDEDLP